MTQLKRKLTKKQIAYLHVIKNELGYSDDEYRAVLMEHAGVASSLEMDQAGFTRVKKSLLKPDEFVDNSPPEGFGQRAGFASPFQVEYISDMQESYFGTGEDSHFRAWISRIFGVSHIRFLDSETAGKVITALREMNARQNSHTHAKDGVQ